MTQDINVLALVKGEERYIFLFDDERKSEALRQLGRYASNPDLSFTWYDAAVLSQKIRQTVSNEEEQQQQQPAQQTSKKKRFQLPLSNDNLGGEAA